MDMSKLCADLSIPAIEYVYATHCTAFPNRIKIGKTKDIKARLSQLNVSCAPCKHKLIALAESFDIKRDEKMAHVFFAEYRREGEFFEVSAKQVKEYFDMFITALHNIEKQNYKHPEEECVHVETAIAPKPRQLSKLEEFVLNFANEQLDQNIMRMQIHGKAFYKKHEAYATANKHKEKDMKSMTAFGRQVKNIDGIFSSRMGTGVVYRLNFAEIKECLEG
jgi:hypothetical protein